jgi:uncharacterized protein YndB with AHSA1/START domain
MRLLRNLILILVGLAVLLAAASYLIPSKVNVSRDIAIAAPPDKVFALVNSTQATTQWSPWTGRDPAIKLMFSGPETGVGNKMEWTSEMREVGQGVQEITESVPNERVTSALDFGDMGQAVAAIVLAPDGVGTRVTWTLDTDMGMNPIARWMGLAMDGMIGKDYEAGLAKLKSLAESG